MDTEPVEAIKMNSQTQTYWKKQTFTMKLTMVQNTIVMDGTIHQTINPTKAPTQMSSQKWKVLTPMLNPLILITLTTKVISWVMSFSKQSQILLFSILTQMNQRVKDLVLKYLLYCQELRTKQVHPPDPTEWYLLSTTNSQGLVRVHDMISMFHIF